MRRSIQYRQLEETSKGYRPQLAQGESLEIVGSEKHCSVSFVTDLCECSLLLSEPHVESPHPQVIFYFKCFVTNGERSQSFNFFHYVTQTLLKRDIKEGKAKVDNMQSLSSPLSLTTLPKMSWMVWRGGSYGRKNIYMCLPTLPRLSGMEGRGNCEQKIYLLLLTTVSPDKEIIWITVD